MTTDAHSTGPEGTDYPVDDATYNLLQALTSKLEAVEAYEQYAADDPHGVFAGLIADERRHAQELLAALRAQLGSS
jgi:rubrerythrin